MIRILIADDHAVVRQGIRQVLALAGQFEVAAEAKDGWELIEMLRDGGFDLLLTDMSMPGPSGVALLKRLREEHPGLPVLVLSMHGETQVAARALKAGANGYVTKDCDPNVLLSAVRKVARGDHFVSPDLAQRMVFETGVGGEAPPHESLSDREYEILLHLVKGERLSEIAGELHLSPKTISTHKMRIMQKLDLKSAAELVRYAIERGLVS
ncbi:two component transcriptional regulator, LuxR family [Thiorhodococcus drewsii AZ1]|uniref:Two component transcriptional regulator, LuxR family n=1 Tax=Thiorhodococcus drewsii AZ1 TaxID=765913 RepID=G2DY52_9GAMM|nr:response regulator transcription factor [Thiorhodococcus drewsii]EGV32844.1 two component transcriptional regulator, LuxR family [Thiorhodococcus drewsii AZ1]